MERAVGRVHGEGADPGADSGACSTQDLWQLSTLYGVGSQAAGDNRGDDLDTLSPLEGQGLIQGMIARFCLSL